ncbi:MAG: hypothetical protein ACKPKO_52390, partial [Candidatus Fonsibacter sp.]
EELAKFDCMTPTTLDFLADYADAVNPMELFFNPSSAAYGPHPAMFQTGDDNEEPDEGAGRMYGKRPQSWISYPNNVLAYDMNRPAGTAYYHKPRGSWKVKKIYALNGGAPRVPLVT